MLVHNGDDYGDYMVHGGHKSTYQVPLTLQVEGPCDH